jgi:hypothetical protein
MLLAMCIDGGIILMMLFWVVVLGALGCLAFVFVVTLILKWVNARRERLRAEAPPAASF